MGFYTMQQIYKHTQAKQVPVLKVCQAKTKAGKPCKNEPLPNLNVCKVHNKAGE